MESPWAAAIPAAHPSPVPVVRRTTRNQVTGRRRRPDQPPLGLRPVGRLAFTGFWTFVAMLAPVLFVSGPDRFGLSIGLLVLLAGVAVFFLSLRRLNRQMVAAKERELSWARDLFVRAFEPVRAEETLEALSGSPASSARPRPWRNAPSASRSGCSTRGCSPESWPSVRQWPPPSLLGSSSHRSGSSLTPSWRTHNPEVAGSNPARAISEVAGRRKGPGGPAPFPLRPLIPA